MEKKALRDGPMLFDLFFLNNQKSKENKVEEKVSYVRRKCKVSFYGSKRHAVVQECIYESKYVHTV